MENRELQVMNFRESDVLRAQRQFDETMERIDRSTRRIEIVTAAIYGAIAGMVAVLWVLAM